jgi:LysM repeat protein
MPVLAEERKPEPTPPAEPSPEATLAPAPIPTPTPAPPQPRLHAVKAGENLTVIAELYSVSLGAVIQANQLENPNLIHPNEQIVIPAQGLAGEGE